MRFLKERATVILRELKKISIVEKIDINNFIYKKGKFITIEEVENFNEEWQKMETNDIFKGEKDSYYWFRTKVKIPKTFLNKKAFLHLSTQAEGGGCQNPSFLLFINGEIIQGVDTKHQEVMLNENIKNEEITIDLQFHTGFFHTDLKISSFLFLEDEEITKLIYDIQVPLWAIESLNEKQETYEIEHHINETINLLDMRNPLSIDFYNSIKLAQDYIEDNIYKKMGGSEDIIASCIGHTHIDVAWRWTVEETRSKVARSFSTVIKLMEEYENYKFMSSQPILYMFLKERYPELFEKIKKLIKEKRWEAEGGMWLESDINLVSGESLIRQFYYGMKFFKDEFNVENNKILWLPDVFGYSGALPQIMKEVGIKYFMTTKLSWNQYNKFPNDTFIWKGIDGSEILTHLITTTELKQNKNNFFTTYNGLLHPDTIIGGWERYQNKKINNNILISYGYGDGGGGPTREMLETSIRMEKGIKGIPTGKQEFAYDYFKRLEEKVINNKRLEKWEGELYFEYHRGTLTSMGRNKKSNRKSEMNLMDLEFLSVLTKESIDYPKFELENIWKKVLLNQFHDILPGSSIEEVYDVTKKEYEQIEDSIANLKEKSLEKLVVKKDNKITVINTVGKKRSDIINLKMGIKKGYLLDDNKNEYIIQNDIVFVSNIPSKGYKVFDLVIENEEKTNQILETKENYENIKTPFYNIKINEKGFFTSIYDISNEREIVEENKELNVIKMYEDKPMWHDNWDIDVYYTEKYYEVNDVKKIRFIEKGPVYDLLEIEREISKSNIKQHIYFYKESKRIDFKTYIDWKDTQHLLKVHFPLNVHSNEATYDIQFGNLQRPTHKNTSWEIAKFETVAHKWVDLSEAYYGVSVLNDCKYGHYVDGNDITLTLLKSGNEPYEKADIEKHEMTYSLYPHNNDVKRSDTIWQGYYLNQEMIAKQGEAVNSQFSFVKSDKENIVIETIKESFDSNSIILRVYESQNALTKVKLEFSNKLEKAFLCDALENVKEEINIKDKEILLEMKPYEIKTIKINLEKM